MQRKIINRKIRHLYPFKSNYLAVDGLQYHYLDEGRGETMVMLHGNPTWSFFYRRLVMAFRGRYRVIVPDHIGCGLSEKPELTEYDFSLARRIRDLDSLIGKIAPHGPITLLVHDWGGMIGLAWALANMNRISRIVIMNTAGFFPPAGRQIPLRLKLIRTANPIMDWAVLHLNLFARAALYMAPRRRLATDVKTGMIAPYDSPRHRLATLKFVQDIPLSTQDAGGDIVADVSKNLSRICDRPTLLLWGARDFVFNETYYEEFKRRLPKAESHWLPEAGHYLLEDAPEQCERLIQAFLDKHR